jgi:hypothetical protein
MARFPLKLPPGIYRNGTEYSSKSRYYDAHLVRFTEGTIRPFGGWNAHSTSTVTGKPRAIITWKDNSYVTWAAIGTESHLYAMSRVGVLYDITPVGFTSGNADATAAGGYGSGTYGTGTYGTPRPDTSLVQDASAWSLDTFGQYLNGVMTEDGIVYEWQLNTAVVAAAVVNAPTGASLFVTQEGMLVVLAAAGIPRRVQWSDQQDNTTWTAGATNQAGDFDLPTNGRLMQGKKIRGSNLILTDIDAWTMTYTADTLVYGFEKIGSGCGAISRNCLAVPDSRAIWMGRTKFWLYDGYVRELPSEVSDYVFSDMNVLQMSKVVCVPNARYSEVKWYYCSGASTEIDRYVTVNYGSDQMHWNIGIVTRLSGVDAGVFTYPLECGSDGYVYDHEYGFSYTGASSPYLETGPIELGNGDNVMYATRLFPDDKTVGDVSATFKVKFEPDASETSFGPYTLSQETDVRFGGRTTKVRYTGVTASDWRVGVPRLELVQGGKR